MFWISFSDLTQNRSLFGNLIILVHTTCTKCSSEKLGHDIATIYCESLNASISTSKVKLNIF